MQKRDAAFAFFVCIGHPVVLIERGISVSAGNDSRTPERRHGRSLIPSSLNW